MNPNDYLDALTSLPKLGTSAISPDGRWAAWSWFGVGPTADVYVVATDASAPPIRLTNTDENAELVSWTPDSRAVLVGQDYDGDKRVRLFRVDLDRPCALQPHTEAAPHYFLRGGQLHP